ncbi:hypothetical protein B484DRAFT_410663 [Ochromonadaceae sp. CCMP2298]|nr:hypothetical protein B484DRAFT_410663 [Ochromonadaceae sp. CCMP2298]
MTSAPPEVPMAVNLDEGGMVEIFGLRPLKGPFSVLMHESLPNGCPNARMVFDAELITAFGKDAYVSLSPDVIRADARLVLDWLKACGHIYKGCFHHLTLKVLQECHDALVGAKRGHFAWRREDAREVHQELIDVWNRLSSGQHVTQEMRLWADYHSLARPDNAMSAFAGVSTRLEYDDSADSTSPDDHVRDAYFRRLEGTEEDRVWATDKDERALRRKTWVRHRGLPLLRGDRVRSLH